VADVSADAAEGSVAESDRHLEGAGHLTSRQVGAESNASGDQDRQVGRGETNAWRGATIVLDLRRLVTMMRKSGAQLGNFGMSLGVVPTDSLRPSEDRIAVVADVAGHEVNDLDHAQFEAVAEIDAHSHNGRAAADSEKAQ